MAALTAVAKPELHVVRGVTVPDAARDALAAKGTKVYYLTGNHDEKLRRFSDTKMGNIYIMDKLVLELDSKKDAFPESVLIS